MSRTFARRRHVRRTLRTAPAVLALTVASGAWGAAGGQVTADSVTGPFAAPRWAYPVRPSGSAGEPNGPGRPLHVPGSRRSYTSSQLADWFAVADWFPATHPQMPAIVARGRRPSVFACGYCHLADGSGRPENAALAGLPRAYIAAQVADMKSGARRPALEGVSPPFDSMRVVATHATNAEIESAARYFSALPFTRPRTTVVESDSAPALRRLNGVYVVAGSKAEPLGRRLIDAATDGVRHERHDPNVQYVTYVPRGSVARGRVLATRGTPTFPMPCVSCHGADLRGVGAAPPIAGRAPSYILRQLLAFKAGTRAAPSGAPMRDVAARLTLDDMIAAAAYVGSVRP